MAPKLETALKSEPTFSVSVFDDGFVVEGDWGLGSQAEMSAK